MTPEKAKIYHELLILKVQAGDGKAFETLVKVWEKSFFSYARAYTGSETAAGDIVQETWLVIIRKIGSLVHPARFKSWAFRILNNKCADAFRKASSERKLHQSVALNGHQETAENPEIETLHQAMRQLTSDQKTLVLLRFNQGMSILEIAKTLHLPEGTVKSRLHRTLNELKTICQGDTHE